MTYESEYLKVKWHVLNTHKYLISTTFEKSREKFELSSNA